MVKWLRVMLVESGKAPVVCELPDNRKALELTVRGSLEITETNRPGCIIIYDGNYKLSKKPENRSDIIGTFVIARIDPPELASLNDEDIEFFSKVYG